MMLLICLVLFLSVQPSWSIIGGELVPYGEAQYYVSLMIFHKGQLDESKASRCGASAFSRTLVLTAAHCFRKPDIVRIDVLYAIDIANEGNISVDLSAVIPHPAFEFPKENDIAFIKLPRPMVVLPGGVKFVQIPKVEPPLGSLITAYGTGWIENYDTGLENGLRKTTMQVFNVTDFNADVGFHWLFVYNPGSTTCFGDSGGPVTVDDRFQVGIIVGGMSGCRLGLPNVFTNVVRYLPWIEEITRLSSISGNITTLSTL